jgi:nucleoside-diphosphate-sugar epimerase
MVNLLGGQGYIGSYFQQRYSCVVNSRDDITPVHPRILYMISTTHNSHPPNNPYIDIDTNLVTLIRVLENARRLPDVEFNFVSSWFVYGHADTAMKESSRCDPQGFYSITKRTAEQLVQEYCRIHQMSWRIMRLCNVIGGHDHTSHTNKNVLNQICHQFSNNQPVTLVNQGNFYRDYLHVTDVCDAMACVMDRGAVNQIYNIGTGSSVRFSNVVDYIRQRTQSQSPLVDQTKFDVIDCLLNCSRLASLDWHPRMSWQQCVDEMLSLCSPDSPTFVS